MSTNIKIAIGAGIGLVVLIVLFLTTRKKTPEVPPERLADLDTVKSDNWRVNVDAKHKLVDEDKAMLGVVPHKMVEKHMTIIRNNATWLEKEKEKAPNWGMTLEQMLIFDGIYLAKKNNEIVEI